MKKVPAAVGVAVSRFNEAVTERLLASCLKTLKDEGVASARVRVARVPGGYELPWAVQELALSGKCGVVIALGAILRGETRQNEHISRSTVQHLHDIALATRVPCILGIITADTFQQAMARTRGDLDRGREAALAALEMLSLRRTIDG